MKINKTLITISLMVITIIALIDSKRSNRVKKSKTNSHFKLKSKDDGSGTWDDGFHCPGLVIANVDPAQKDNKLKFTEKEELFFKPKQILGAIGKHGIFLQFKKVPSDALKEVLVAGDEGFYLPYRFMQNNFQYVREGALKWRIIQGYLTNDENKNFFVRLTLPRSTVGHIISTEQCENLIFWINKRREEYQGHIITHKKKVFSLSVDIIEGKLLLEKMQKEKNEKDNFKKTNDEEKKKVKADKENLEKLILDKNKKIEELQIQINNFKNEQAQMVNELGSYSKKLEFLENSEKEFENFMKDQQATELNLNQKIEEQTKEVMNFIDYLKRMCVNENKHIKGLTEKVTYSKDSKEIMMDLNKMYPFKSTN